MDLHMPELDGVAATRAIRALPGAPSRVPIVALTADAFAETRERCFAAGMDAFLSKPVSLDALAQVLARHAPSPLVSNAA
jgi:CheY-like chemotaxis protein